MRYAVSYTALVAMSVLMSGIMLAQQPTAKKTTTKTSAPQATHQDAGERAFQENCSRCHYAPQSLSPRITGTVVRHMRVRANLSARDEQLILEFLNP